jgi:hypothetical protein
MQADLTVGEREAILRNRGRAVRARDRGGSDRPFALVRDAHSRIRTNCEEGYGAWRPISQSVPPLHFRTARPAGRCLLKAAPENDWSGS